MCFNAMQLSGKFLHYLISLLLASSCPESDVAECPVLVKTEVDSVTVKEESPVDKMSCDKCVTQEGGKMLDASKQHES